MPRSVGFSRPRKKRSKTQEQSKNAKISPKPSPKQPTIQNIASPPTSGSRRNRRRTKNRKASQQTQSSSEHTSQRSIAAAVAAAASPTKSPSTSSVSSQEQPEASKAPPAQTPTQATAPSLKLGPPENDWLTFCKVKEANEATRMQKSRAKKALNDAVDDVVSKLLPALVGIGSLDRQCAAFRSLLSHPDVKKYTHAIGLDPEDIAFKNKAFERMKTMFEETKPSGYRKKTNDDKYNFNMNVMMSLAETPVPKVNPSNSPLCPKKLHRSRSQYNARLQKELGIAKSTFHKKMRQAKARRYNLKHGATETLWSRMSRRKSFRKVDHKTTLALHEWVANHPNVVRSPIAKDTIKVKKLDDEGKVVLDADKKPVLENKTKLLLQISFRELYADLMKPENQGGFNYAYDKNGQPRVSDTSLRYLVPPKLRK